MGNYTRGNLQRLSNGTMKWSKIGFNLEWIIWGVSDLTYDICCIVCNLLSTLDKVLSALTTALHQIVIFPSFTTLRILRKYVKNWKYILAIGLFQHHIINTRWVNCGCFFFLLYYVNCIIQISCDRLLPKPARINKQEDNVCKNISSMFILQHSQL